VAGDEVEILRRRIVGVFIEIPRNQIAGDVRAQFDGIDGFSAASVISVIGIVEREILYKIVESILEGNLKKGLEVIDDTLNQGYDVYQIYRGLISVFRNMMILKVYESVPPFLYVGEEEYTKLTSLLKGVEYYEIQNMLNYILKAEDLLRGLFPKVSLEILYINLYNLLKLRDVEKVIDGLSKHEPKAMDKYEYVKEESVDNEFTTDTKGFVGYLKKKKPFVGSIFETLDIKIENGIMVVLLDKNYSFIREDKGLQEEIRKHLSDFFGREMDFVLKEPGEKKKDVLREFVQEAELLFKT